jgi:gliding motility-associated-like protein
MLALFGLFLPIPAAAQHSEHDHHHDHSHDVPGFDQAALRAELEQKGMPESEIPGYIRYKKEEFFHKQNGTWNKITPGTENGAKVMSTPCTNMDFETGNFTGWTGKTGTVTSCCPTTGIVAGRHTIMNPGFDPIIPALSTVAPGGNFSVRLGNSSSGAEAEQLEQTFTVTPTTTSFTYQYAVVLEDPSHSPSEQPYFRIEMFDQANALIPCSQYYVAAAANIPGFQTVGSVRWKNWTTVNVDLSNYVGQNVTIRFTTGDCTLGGHYGYAYIDGSCLMMALNQSATLCTGDQITIAAPPGSASYLWSPNGETNDSILVSQPGTYCCTMTSVQGCQQQLCITVQQFPKPTANFNVSTPNCSLTATFTDSSYNGNITQWNWDFGDGNTSPLQSPVHTYANGGLYNVQLIITTQAGCSDTLVRQLTPGGVPVANFTQNMICLSGAFTDATITTQGNIVSWQWDFGDPASAGNNTSVFQNPSHNFSAPGLYNIMLIATTDSGCVDTVITAVNVTTQLNANFSSSIVCHGGTTTFTDLSTSSAGTISTWNWDFNDATPNGTSQNPTHVYANPGTYNVTLTASTNTGCVGVITKTVVVNPVPQPLFTNTNVCHTFVMPFTNQSTILTGNIASYSWDFGDGNTSALTSPNHTYNNPGTYNVTLVAVSDSGCSNTIIQQVTVHPNPVVSFVADDVDGCAAHCVNFSDLTTIATGSVATWTWDFGDGDSSTLQNPSHCFILPTTYNITLTATSNNGCTITQTLPNYITAYPSPVAGFTSSPNPTTVLSPLVQFTDLSSGATSWQWDFGDGDSTLLLIMDHPYHLYSDSAAGIYQVMQVVTSSNGCTDTAYGEVVIEPDFTFYIPNAFTPNGDGKNDLFFGTGIGIDKFDLFVFDRWGNMIFHGDELYKMWDGKYKGNLVQEDVYVWKVVLTDVFRKKHTYIGHVTVIR